MNRNNFWTHLGIAVLLIGLAAIIGQIVRWESSLSSQNTVKVSPKPIAVKRSSAESEPEVLVKFRPNISLAEIKKIAAKNNDRVEDEIETVKGLVAIDDLDNADAKKIAEQYAHRN